MSIFQDVLVRKPGRSLFNLTHEKKFSADWSYLYPIMCTELVPGDTFKVSTEVFIRTAPLVAPIMHRVNVKLNYFFVPNRLVWDEWEDFITGVNQSATYDPTDTSTYFVTKVPPYCQLTSAEEFEWFKDGTLADFLGFPTYDAQASEPDTTAAVNVQLMPFRAYQKIYNDWFRNQNVEGEPWSETSGGLQTLHKYNTTVLRKRMWEKDYFTSCLPFAQRGDAVKIPIAAASSIVYNDSGSTIIRNGAGNAVTSQGFISDRDGEFQDADSGNERHVDNSSNLRIADTVIGTINDLRLATRLQRWLEINARVGGRYIEQVLGHFGIRSSDARLQRAEYLGGWSAPIVVDAIDQSSATMGDDISGTTTPQGNQAGKGTAYNSGKSIKCFAEEHGFLIGLLSITPRTSYQDGLPRMFQRNYKEDYYFPEFANLGEQEVNKAELFFDLTDKTNRSFERFGFQERFCEYKYIPSTVHGEFKNNLQFWHLGRSFTSQPSLTKDFVTCTPRTNVFAVESGAANFYVNLINHVSAMRPMPRQAIPSL